MVQTRSQWRASASRLSPELLRMTFAWFCPHCRGNFEWQHWADRCDGEQHEQDVCSLVNLCRVSVAFRNAAQEVLYHSFDTRYPTTSRSRLQLELFLRSIAARPDLARSVKAVILDPGSIANLDFFASRDAFDHCAHALGTSALDLWKQTEHAHRANPQTQHQGCEALFVRDADPGSWATRPFIPFLASELLTMLVALLPNLSYLKVDSPIEQLDLSRVTSDAIGLTRLPLKTLDTTLRFESLLELSPDIGALVCRSGISWDNLPSVQSLVIATHSVDHLAIQHVLAACTGHLSNFSYRGTRAPSEEIVRVLSTERLHATLESIHIDCRSPVIGFLPPDRIIPSFRPFINLRTLFLSISLMNSDTESDSQALVNILPISITSLTLVVNEGGSSFARLRDQLVCLAKAKAKASVFKHLSRIRCNAFQACDEYVKDLFKQVGVDFMYQEFPRWDSYPLAEIEPLFPLPWPESDDDL